VGVEGIPVEGEGILLDESERVLLRRLGGADNGSPCRGIKLFGLRLIRRVRPISGYGRTHRDFLLQDFCRLVRIARSLGELSQTPGRKCKFVSDGLNETLAT